MADFLQRHGFSSPEGRLHGGRFFGFHANQPDARMQVSADQGHAGRQTAAADRYEQVVDGCAGLPEQFQGDGRLAGNDIRVIVGVDEYPIFLLSQLQSALAGGVEIITMNDHGSAQFFHGVDLDVRRDRGHDNDRIDAEMACRQGNSLGVVTG